MKIKSYYLTNKHEIYRFTAIGFFTLTINILIFTIFFQFTNLGESKSTTFAYWLTVAVHFIMNRNYTFNANMGAFNWQILKYFLLLIFNYLVTILGLLLLVDLMKFSPYVNIFCSTITNALISYLIMKYVIFYNEIKKYE